MADSSRYLFDLDRNPVPQGNAPDAGAFESSFIASINSRQNMKTCSIYPNPSSGIVHIERRNSPTGQNQWITIHDQSGKLVHMQHMLNGISTMDLTKLSKGTYFVKPGLSEQAVPHILQ
jgi:hypothetical protein